MDGFPKELCYSMCIAFLEYKRESSKDATKHDSGVIGAMGPLVRRWRLLLQLVSEDDDVAAPNVATAARCCFLVDVKHPS